MLFVWPTWRHYTPTLDIRESYYLHDNTPTSRRVCQCGVFVCHVPYTLFPPRVGRFFDLGLRNFRFTSRLVSTSCTSRHCGQHCQTDPCQHVIRGSCGFVSPLLCAASRQLPKRLNTFSISIGGSICLWAGGAWGAWPPQPRDIHWPSRLPWLCGDFFMI